jgi:hypothetical protein
VFSGFRRDVDEVCPLLGYCTASCDNYLPTFWDNLSVTSSRVLDLFFLDLLTFEDGSDMLPRNVGKQLPLAAA